VLEKLAIDDVLGWGPCAPHYNGREKLLAITGGREELTLLEACDLDIPTTDVFWLLLRDEVMDARTARLLACDFAGHVAHIWVPPAGCDWKPSATLDVVRRFAEGQATDEELTAAETAAAWAARSAGAAAGAAAGDAAGDAAGAAGAAAGAAAGDAAWAAGAAARAAAWAAAWAAAGAAGAAGAAAKRDECRWQRTRLREELAEQ